MKYGNNTDLIFENYEHFLNENREDFNSPANAIEMLTSDGAFRSYLQALTEGLTPEQQQSIYAVAQRQREMLLEESVQLGPSASIIGYAVTYFPILVDIYSEPLLSMICTTYPTQKPIVSLPKYEIKASVKNTNGTVSTYILPRPQHLIRAGLTDVTPLNPGENNDIYTLAGGGLANATNSRINKRYFIINKMNITDNASGTNPTYDLNILVRPDARGQVEQEIQFKDSNNADCIAKIIGNINWDTGILTYSVIFTGTAGVTYTCNYCSANTMFSPTTGDFGRVKVSPQLSMWDIDVDVRDDFEIELQTELIQDYRDIYNIDIIRTMSEAIKTQIMLNKDQDISYFLQSNEIKMQENGAYQSVDLDRFTLTGAEFRPSNILDVLKGVIPHINSVARIIHRNFRAAPQYVVAGLKTAALLDSLQEFVINMPDMSRGETGFVAKNLSFRKMTVVPCLAIPDDKIYVLYKAPTENPAYTSIIDIVYKPLYIVEEITNSMKRTYVKSRTAIEVTAPHALGVIKVINMDDYIF